MLVTKQSKLVVQAKKPIYCTTNQSSSRWMNDINFSSISCMVYGLILSLVKPGKWILSWDFLWDYLISFSAMSIDMTY